MATDDIPPMPPVRTVDFESLSDEKKWAVLRQMFGDSNAGRTAAAIAMGESTGDVVQGS